VKVLRAGQPDVPTLLANGDVEGLIEATRFQDMSDSSNVKCPDTVASSKAGLPADGRMRYANWGKGLALPPGDHAGANGNWWAVAAEQNCWTNGVDLDSVDLRWFTDPDQGSSTRYGYLYGENIRNLRHADASDGSMQPHWAVVETGWPFSQTAAQGGRRSCRPRCARPYGTR
jgi:hypothetical protein